MRVPLPVADLLPGSTRVVRIGALELLVCNVEGELFALENRCPHQDFGLGDARLSGPVIECSLHGGRFDVRDGCPTRAPTTDRLTTYPVHVSDRGPEIEIDEIERSPKEGRA